MKPKSNALQTKQGYIPGEENDSKLLQMEQTLKANPGQHSGVADDWPPLQNRKGDLIRCVVYYKRILKIHPEDPFALSQVRQLLHNQDRDAVLSPTKLNGLAGRIFIEHNNFPSGSRWSFAFRETFHLLTLVLVIGLAIALLHSLRLIPGEHGCKRVCYGSARKLSLTCDESKSRSALRTRLRALQTWGC